MSRFFRRPESGSDENSWAQYNDAHILEAIGECNVTVYDDSDVLKISKGRIGINDGVHEGVCIIDTITTISYSHIALTRWAELYMTVSGATVTFTLLEMADFNMMIVPATFKNAYIPEKGGYYINSTRRCIALVYKGGGGKIGGIINCLNNCEGYNGYCYASSTKTAYMNWQVTKNAFKKWAICPIPSWNMDTTSSVTVATLTSLGGKNCAMTAVIIDDNGDTWNLSFMSPGGALGGGIFMGIAGNIGCYRVTGGYFDDPLFNDTGVVPRGYVYCEFIEE